MTKLPLTAKDIRWLEMLRQGHLPWELAPARFRKLLHRRLITRVVREPLVQAWITDAGLTALREKEPQ